MSDPDWKALAGELRESKGSYLQDGTRTTLTDLCRHEPEWAASQMKHMAAQLLAALDRLVKLGAKQPTAEEVEGLVSIVNWDECDADDKTSGHLRSLLARLTGGTQ